jgi:hypothetical protein
MEYEVVVTVLVFSPWSQSAARLERRPTRLRLRQARPRRLFAAPPPATPAAATHEVMGSPHSAGREPRERVTGARSSG